VTRWTYGLKPERMARVLQRNPIFISYLIALFSLLSSCALVKIELLRGLFLVSEVIEPQVNYMEELYSPSEYKLTWMLCCYFYYIAYLFYIYQTYIFCNSHEIHFRTIGDSLL
jgi:hypothetical protein